jgi:predicted DNA-binding protein
MGAPKGNQNGAATKFKPLFKDEQTKIVSTRLPLSEIEQLDELIAKSGKSKSDWLRELIQRELNNK